MALAKGISKLSFQLKLGKFQYLEDTLILYRRTHMRKYYKHSAITVALALALSNSVMAQEETNEIQSAYRQSHLSTLTSHIENMAPMIRRQVLLHLSVTVRKRTNSITC